MARSDAMWRSATLGDVGTIMAIQAEVHPLLSERDLVIADKIATFPDGCCILHHDESALGYALGHPYLLDHVPALDAKLGMLPATADCFFIHDVALLPAARGQGAAKAYVGRMRDVCARRGLGWLALVSVYGTVPIWEGCGFRIRAFPGLADKFGPVGDMARYMAAEVGARL